MGADSFIVVATGDNAQQAFDKAVKNAQHENGHGGYTGTIAEKRSFRIIHLGPAPEGKKTMAWATDEANRLLEECDPRIDDKWGDAGCFALGVGENKMGIPTYVFFGYASS